MNNYLVNFKITEITRVECISNDNWLEDEGKSIHMNQVVKTCNKKNFETLINDLKKVDKSVSNVHAEIGMWKDNMWEFEIDFDIELSDEKFMCVIRGECLPLERWLVIYED